MTTAARRPLLLELTDTHAHGREISLAIRGFQIKGQVALESANLHLDGPDGTVTAARLVVTSVTITGHGLRLGGQQLEATDATVGWGHHGLIVEAKSVSISALQVIGDDEPYEGTLVLDGITLSNVAVHGDDVRIGRVRIANTEAEAKLPGRADAADGERGSDAGGGSAAILQWLLPVLDRLTGHVNVDLGLDLTVPVIGRRRATHHFRVPIHAGTINYRRLEDNLSTLEDALLDFSARDEGLVLEVGIPLLPTRGKGKPIVTWPLEGEELEQARQDLVRLSVLARPTLNGKSNGDDASGEDKESPVALRKADVHGLDVSLAVSPAEDSTLRRIGLLVVNGDITYATDEAPEGVIRAGAQDVEIGGLSSGRISIGGVRIDAASDIEVGFLGVTPVRARIVARTVQVEGLHIASRASHAPGTDRSAPPASASIS
jgi:hypothetical protein